MADRLPSLPWRRRVRHAAESLLRMMACTYVARRGEPPAAGSWGRRLWDNSLGFGREDAYEPKVRAAIEAIVKPGWICADVGACRGVITSLLAEMVGPTGMVIAFEAFPENADRLQCNLKLKGLASRVKVENLAVTDGSEPQVWLFQGREAHAEEWNIVGHDVEGNPTEAKLRVPAVSLDEYFSGRLDFVKIDIEGSAGSALRGMWRLLREARPVLLIEFHDEAEWRSRKGLYQAGYELWHEGRRLDPDADTTRVYHCLATPTS